MPIIKTISGFLKNRSINEGRIYWSPKFTEVIRKVFATTDNMNIKKMSSILLNSYGDEIKDDITFVDFSPNTDYVTYLRGNSFSKVAPLKERGLTPDNQLSRSLVDGLWQMDQTSQEAGPFNDPSRTEIKISKLINKIITDTSFTTKDRELFVNSIKSAVQSLKKTFKVVSGQDIKTYYDGSKHSSDGGTLGNSCMRYSKCQDYLDIYSQNPDVCKLLVLVDGEDKVHGRALLWDLYKSEPTGIEKFMDRIYFIQEYDLDTFKRWAKENGYIYKEENNYRNLAGVVMPDSSIIQAKMWVKCSGKYTKYPYLDTFRLYDPKTGILENNLGNDVKPNIGKYVLSQTDGSYYEILDQVWSDWHDQAIPLSDAVESRVGWIYGIEAVVILEGSDDIIGIWPHSHQDVFYDKKRQRYLHSDDLVVDPHSGSILPLLYQTEAILIINELYKNSKNWMLKWYEMGKDPGYILFKDLENLQWFSRWKNKFSQVIQNPQTICPNSLLSEDIISGFSKEIMIQVMCIDNSGGEVTGYSPENYAIEVHYSKDFGGMIREKEAKDLGMSVEPGSKTVSKIDYYIKNAPNLIQKYEELSLGGNKKFFEKIQKLRQFLDNW
jgi:hypothetical protein